jgi:hypothetical protein
MEPPPATSARERNDGQVLTKFLVPFILKRGTYEKTRSNPGFQTLIAATCKLWQPYHLTYDQARDVAKVVRQILYLARPNMR